jgi:membrane protease subunit HflC
MRCAASAGLIAALVLAGIGAIVLSNSVYVVPETEQVVLLQFGQVVGTPQDEAGLHWKVPFVQTAYRLERRILGWDGPATEMPTKDKLYIVVDCFARWKITDARLFLKSLRDYRTADSRLDDVIGGATRNTVAKNDLIEVVRTTRERKPSREAAAITAATSAPGVTAAVVDAVPEKAAAPEDGLPVSGWVPIRVGRNSLEQEIYHNAKKRIGELGLGIELLDFRFKRINYNARVTEKIYDRMISERSQIAEQFRSEGAGAAAKINGERERTLLDITSNAYRQVQEINGKADAEAAGIYSQAYNGSPQSREFYEFTKTMDAYKTILDPGTSLILSTDSELFRFLKTPGEASRAAGAPVANP